MHGHFGSHDKDGCHTIQSNIADNPCFMQTSWLYVLCNVSYCPSKFYIVGTGIFKVFCSCDFDIDQRPLFTNLTRIAWRYTRCANTNSPHQGCLMFSSDRQWDTTKIIYHAALRVSTTYVFLSCQSLVVSSKAVTGWSAHVITVLAASWNRFSVLCRDLNVSEVKCFRALF